MTTHLEYLGHCWSVIPGGRVLHRTFVLWLPVRDEELLRGLLRLVAEDWACPECGLRWPLERQGGAILNVAPHPRVRKVSDTCSQCQTIVHFDCTDAVQRADLKWTGLYEREPRWDDGRFARFPPAPRQLAGALRGDTAAAVGS